VTEEAVSRLSAEERKSPLGLPGKLDEYKRDQAFRGWEVVE
jgi:hypothetical protein